ncbi:MAG: CinA family protein [Enterobacter hormaechei]
MRHETIERFTAVSEQTVTEMAAKIRDIAEADIGVAISGYAGPEGGDDGTAAGTVCFGWNIRGRRKPAPCCFPVNVRMWWRKRCVIRCLN